MQIANFRSKNTFFGKRTSLRSSTLLSFLIPFQLGIEESTPPVISADGSRYVPHHRVVHLDLKGAPPKLSYLHELFPILRDAGATAILLEYEDMFPFWGSLRNISAKNAYSQRDVQNLQKWATQNDLIVIPLVQTFGHLEFVLKLDEFKELREVPIYPQSICPSQDKSWNLIKEMIDQVNPKTTTNEVKSLAIK